MTLKNNGIIDQPSKHSVDQTVEKLRGILQAKGVALFALIDHSGEAEKVGMKMPPTKLLIFGNPKAGTPLMLAAPSIAIDLPLKILVWEDLRGKVWVSYNSPAYLQERHSLPPELLQNIAVVEGSGINRGNSSPSRRFAPRADDLKFEPGKFLFVIRNEKQSEANIALPSWTMISTMRGERSGSRRLPELRRYWICCEARGLER